MLGFNYQVRVMLPSGASSSLGPSDCGPPPNRREAGKRGILLGLDGQTAQAMTHLARQKQQATSLLLCPALTLMSNLLVFKRLSFHGVLAWAHSLYVVPLAG